MLVYVALSGDCCGEPFEGIFGTLEAAKARVEKSGRPEAVEEWETSPRPEPLRRWAYRFSDGWVEQTPNSYRT